LHTVHTHLLKLEVQKKKNIRENLQDFFLSWHNR